MNPKTPTEDTLAIIMGGGADASAMTRPNDYPNDLENLLPIGNIHLITSENQIRVEARAMAAMD
jgi:hypothetical protein